MSQPIPVKFPLLNPNEPEALLAALHVSEGQQVAEDDPICTLETTKSTADLVAEASGYVRGLRFIQGQTVHAGEILCYLAESAEWSPPQPETPDSAVAPEAERPEGLRITQPALALASQHGLELSQLPVGPLVTESLVRMYIEKNAARPEFSPPESAFDPTAIIVYGGGGHGKSLIDLLRSLGTYHITGVIDDGLHANHSPADMPTIMGVPLLGGGEVLPDLHARGIRLAVNAVGGIGNVAIRIKIFRKLAEAGFTCPTVAHPTAFVEASALLSAGVQVFPHAYVGSEARAGFGTIINTGAIVSHDCVLGDYVNISPGAVLAGEVQVGAGALIGMGVTVNLQVKIGAGARIGNGATVKADVPERGMVRAGTIWPA